VNESRAFLGDPEEEEDREEEEQVRRKNKRKFCRNHLKI